MVKEKYKGINVKKAKTSHILDLITEIFVKYDLNDNSSIDFNNLMSELQSRLKSLEKSVREANTKLKKEITVKNKYKDNFFKIATQKQIQKLLEETIEK